MEFITPEEARARVDAGRDLDAVSLHAADLAGLGLAGRSFRDSVLVQVGFSHALLDAACFAGASLTECDLSGTTLTGGDLASALLARCNLERSVADRCRGHQLKLVDCRLDGAAWRDCDLDQAVCGNSTADGLVLTGSRFVQGLLVDGAMPRATCERVDFTGSLIANMNFTQAMFAGATFFPPAVTRISFLRSTIWR